MKNQKNSPIINYLTIEKTQSGLGDYILFNGITIGRLYKSGLVTNPQGCSYIQDPEDALADLLSLKAEEAKGLYQKLLYKVPAS